MDTIFSHEVSPGLSCSLAGAILQPKRARVRKVESQNSRAEIADWSRVDLVDAPATSSTDKRTGRLCSKMHVSGYAPSTTFLDPGQAAAGEQSRNVLDRVLYSH